MSDTGTTTPLKQRGKCYCFNHTKPFQRLVVESPRVLGASFFTLNTEVDAWCCIFIPLLPPPPLYFLVLF